jgi:FkbM family methyltransferase
MAPATFVSAPSLPVRTLRILYLGNFQPGIERPWSTENHGAASLESLGHSVIRAQEGEARAGEIPKLAEAEDVDLFLWTRTPSLVEGTGTKEELDAMLATLEGMRIPTVAWHLDRYWGLSRERDVPEDPWFRCRFVFSPDGGSDERWAEAGVNHRWLRPGVFEAECVFGEPREEYECDVAFVGSKRYHPEWPWRPRLLDFLRRVYRGRFRLFPDPGQPAIRGQDLNDLYASAKVVVGDSCALGPKYWSDRICETWGRGGFLVMPRIEGLEEDFPDGPFYELGDLDSVQAQVDYWLAHRGERESLRDRNHVRVKASMTYRHRLSELLEAVAREEPFLRVFPEVRPGTTDAVVVREVMEENVYRLQPDMLRDSGVVIDVGANVGAFSLFACRLGAKRVVAVEPSRENCAQLARNLQAAGAVRAEVARLALGEREGTAEVVFGEAGTWTRPRRKGGELVDVMTLDGLMAYMGIEEADVLKVDVEGAEHAILAGVSSEALARIRHVVIEFHGLPMTGRSVPPGSLGTLVEKLARTHETTVIGRPEAGGMVYARRYEP